MLAEFTHRLRLMRSDAEVGAGFAGTQQDEARLPVLGIVLFRIGLIDFTFALQMRGAGEAVALMTQGRQDDSGFESRIPDVFFRAYLQELRFVVVEQFDLKEIRVGHISKVVLPGGEAKPGVRKTHFSQQRREVGHPFYL